MGRFQQYEKHGKDEPKTVHPIWRGIGFLLIGLIAVMSYAGASILVRMNKTRQWITVPAAIQGGFSWAPDLFSELIVAFFLSLIGFGIMTIIYSFFYQISRPRDIFKYLR